MKVISPTALLLKYEGYPSAVVAAILIHGLILYFIIGSGALRSDFVDVEQPVYIAASVIEANPQRLRRLEQVEEQRQVDQQADQRRRDAARDAELEAQQQAQRIERERTEQVEADRVARELANRLSREEAERLQRIEDQARRAENERLAQLAIDQAETEAERARQAAAQRQSDQAASDNSNVASYLAIMRDAVTGNWSVPPSARNGMIVEIRLRLVPTGEIVSSTIIQASGDAAFDRSALQAVGRVGRFPELQQMENRLFEQNFRIIDLRFKPEDLLR